jgi:hypothetical protein
MDDAQQPLGEVLAQALDARGVWQEQPPSAVAPPPAAPKPAVKLPSLFTLAKNANAASYVAARRRQEAGRSAVPRKR